MQLSVDLDRIKSDILALAEIGRNEQDGGIYRMAFTDADMEGKRWLADQIGKADLECTLDGAVNVSATLTGKRETPRILVGSHIDTVPCAGSLDGTLGVVAGLECLRCLKRAGVTPARTIELIAFSDEEGRFGGMFGSQSVCGELNPRLLSSMSDLNGVKLQDELQRHGYNPIDALEAARDPESIAA
jgi:N-carbamoyl-L-amino-acid hydrolase